MQLMNIQNALIEKTMLGIEDHNIMTCFLYLDYGDGGHQGAGGYSLDSRKGIDYIRAILDIVGVSQWEHLKGKYIRVKREHGRGQIIAIGNLLKDEWLELSTFFKN